MATATFRGNVTYNAGAPKPWNAYHASGQFLGSFENLRDGQKVVEAAFGGIILSWEETDLGSSVTSFNGNQYS